MKTKLIFLIFFTISLTLSGNIINPLKMYDWAIIGAGPAGVTAIAVLLEHGVDGATIVWIDPEFNVGRMGKYYRNVPGNLQTKRLVTYANNCPLFKAYPSSSRELLYTFNQEAFQPLHIMVDPASEFTHYLQTLVDWKIDCITSLDLIHNEWNLTSINHYYKARKVILAIGSHPKRLHYDLPEIPMDLAIDKETLASFVGPEDTIAIFGSMHSAFLIIKYLTELPIKKIINFYNSYYFFGKPGTAGLEGITASWVKNILENNPPSNLVRVLNTPENRNAYLSDCTKVIYAIGYEQNTILVNGKTTLPFNEETGIIEQNLYGIGIAFAPTEILANGKRVALNGFNTYLNYAQELIPQWIKNNYIS